MRDKRFWPVYVFVRQVEVQVFGEGGVVCLKRQVQYGFFGVVGVCQRLWQV